MVSFGSCAQGSEYVEYENTYFPMNRNNIMGANLMDLSGYKQKLFLPFCFFLRPRLKLTYDRDQLSQLVWMRSAIHFLFYA